MGRECVWGYCLWEISFSQISPLPVHLSKKYGFFYSRQDQEMPDQTRAEHWNQSRPVDTRSPLVYFTTVNSSMLMEMCVLCMCLTKTEKEKARETLRCFMTSCLCMCVCFWMCVCLSEKVLQWCIYDTPFTSGGASCLSFFIPRSLMSRWWWRDGPSPPALRPPWDEEGPPPPPAPPPPPPRPEECCTLRSLFPSTRIWGNKYNTVPQL